MNKDIKICAYCKNEMRPLDNHAIKFVADSTTDKSLVMITCQLTRYDVVLQYYQVEAKDVNL